MKRCFYVSVLLIMAINLLGANIFAQTDTVRVMAYNVLNYGQVPNCQGPVATYHTYLKTIVQFANPDIITLEKMATIQSDPLDFHGTAPTGFGDSILQYALNAAYPGRFGYCPFTNLAQTDNMSMLFYNKNKFGFAGIVISYSNITDFNCYKLYYKDPNLATTHDTTFLYIIPNHDISGSGSSADRGLQIAGYMQHVQNHFSKLPNMITMGDFNLRYTTEPLYQTLTAPADTNFRFYDPPFYPDAHLSYPANWDSNPAAYTAYLTTSTRQSASVPNSCGTSGGGKNWYDHIFISPWIANNTNYIKYIPNSYRTIGNDGHRLGISINDNSSVTNTSAPANVLDALFQMSNKYPVMIDLAITPNTTGISITDPELLATAVPAINEAASHIAVVNPVADHLVISVPTPVIGSKVTVLCYDALGRVIMEKKLDVQGPLVQLPFLAGNGIYFLKLYGNTFSYHTTIYKK